MTLKVSSIVKTGIVVFIAIIILFWGLNYLKGIDFLNPDNSYYVVYDKVDGLEKSADV
ncbi:MAG: MCE family protein, partial [Chlorobi bacterium]|nr:MCE family protein [Chlorobiota bacterium]